MEVISRLGLFASKMLVYFNFELSGTNLSCENWKQNLCVTAAYRPVRELIQLEREKDMVY